MYLFVPLFESEQATLVPRHVDLWNKPHQKSPQANVHMAPTSPGRHPRRPTRPNKAHRLPAAQKQLLISPHNYSVGPVKRPEMVSLPYYSHICKDTAGSPGRIPKFSCVCRGTKVNKRRRLKIEFRFQTSPHYDTQMVILGYSLRNPKLFAERMTKCLYMLHCNSMSITRIKCQSMNV